MPARSAIHLLTPGVHIMIDVELDKLEETVAYLQKTLKDGLMATDIWDRGTGLSFAGYNAQPEAVALFNVLTDEVASTLEGSAFPGLGRYYVLDVEGDAMVVIIRHDDDLMQGILLNSVKVNLGVLFGMALPKVTRLVTEATVVAA